MQSNSRKICTQTRVKCVKDLLWVNRTLREPSRGIITRPFPSHSRWKSILWWLTNSRTNTTVRGNFERDPISRGQEAPAERISRCSWLQMLFARPFEFLCKHARLHFLTQWPSKEWESDSIFLPVNWNGSLIQIRIQRNHRNRCISSIILKMTTSRDARSSSSFVTNDKLSQRSLVNDSLGKQLGVWPYRLLGNSRACRTHTPTVFLFIPLLHNKRRGAWAYIENRPHR